MKEPLFQIVLQFIHIGFSLDIPKNSGMVGRLPVEIKAGWTVVTNLNPLKFSLGPVLDIGILEVSSAGTDRAMLLGTP